MTITENSSGGQASPATQLKQLLKEKMNEGVGLAAKAAGQQAGTVAQAVRQAGEELRQQGRAERGSMADRVAAPVQRWSGSLSEADPEQLTSGVKSVKPKVSEKTQELKAQASGQLKKQTRKWSAQAGRGLSGLNDGLRLTGQQLRAQGDEAPALALDLLTEKVEPLGRYLTTTDADRLATDVAGYARQAKAGLSSAASAVTRTQQVAAKKTSNAVKQTGMGIRRSPMLPIAGLVVGGLVAARRAKKARSGQDTTTASARNGASQAEDLQNLTRAQLQQRALASGVPTAGKMTKNQLIEALTNS